MTESELLARAFSLAISAVGFWYFLVVANTRFHASLLRQRLFEIRGELFLLAGDSDKGFGFDHPGYGLLRTTLNGFIRSVDRLGIVSQVLMWLTGRRGLYLAGGIWSFEERWEAAIRDAHPVIRERLVKLVREMNDCVIEYLANNSLSLRIAVFPWLAWEVYKRTRSAAMPFGRPSFVGRYYAPRSFLNELDSLAHTFGRAKSRNAVSLGFREAFA